MSKLHVLCTLFILHILMIHSQYINIESDEDDPDVSIKIVKIINYDNKSYITDDKYNIIRIDKAYYKFEVDSDRIVHILDRSGKKLNVADGFEKRSNVNGDVFISKEGYPDIRIPKVGYSIVVDSNGTFNIVDDVFKNPIIELKPLPPQLKKLIGSPVKKSYTETSRLRGAVTTKEVVGAPLSPTDFEEGRKLPEIEAPATDEPDEINPDLLEGDLIIESETDLRRMLPKGGAYSAYSIPSWITSRKKSFKERAKWPDGIVPYTIDNAYNDYERAKIAKAIEFLHTKTCVRFMPKTEDHFQYVFIHKGGGCASLVGRSQRPGKTGKQYIHLGRECLYKWKTIATAFHEMMHTLGFWHEHTRSDRDQYVQILWENIRKEEEHNFNKRSEDEIVDLNLPYDYGSVMHYGRKAFRKQGYSGKYTILPNENDVEIGQRTQISKLDIRGINLFYNCTMKMCDPECVYGECNFARCDCDPHWTGPQCDKRIEVCDPGCWHGECISAQCECDSGWTGPGCYWRDLGYDWDSGTNRNAPSNQVCSVGWTGPTCNLKIHNGGSCPDRNKPCLCPEGYTGRTCKYASCSPPCINGHCTSPNKCTCLDGYGGPTCDRYIKCEIPCVFGECDENKGCKCYPGWTGHLCNIRPSYIYSW